MKRIMVLLLVLSLPALPLVAETRGDDKGSAKNAALEQFKQLTGEWVGKGKHGDLEHEARIVYKVTSGGTAVSETIDPGGEHEMITMIHPDVPERRKRRAFAELETPPVR